jgi:glycerate dehydrogenase
MRGVFLDLDTMAPQDLNVRSLETVLPAWQSYHLTTPEQRLERIRGCQVVVVQKVALDAAILHHADALRLICVAATGTNNVDLQAAERRHIPVCNVRHYAMGAVPQHVFALTLSLVTRLFDYHGAVREGRWPQSKHFCLLDYPIRELAGMTLGIIGFGNLGRTVARIGEGFGMNILVSERPGGAAQPGRVPLTALLAQSDVVTLHCPLTEQTKGLIGQQELALMKQDALLINTARGGIVDERALAEALREGVIGGAGCDVLSVEPPVDGNPLLSHDIPNLIVTPHVAWGSRAARQRIIDEVVLNIQAFLRGEPRNQILPTMALSARAQAQPGP